MTKKNLGNWCPNWSCAGWFWTIVSEAAFYAALYYGQFLLKVSGNLGISSLVLLVLLNLAVVTSPIFRKHFL